MEINGLRDSGIPEEVKMKVYKGWQTLNLERYRADRSRSWPAGH